METFEELTEWVLAALPNAILDESAGGEITILTGFSLPTEDRLVPLAAD